MSRFHSKGESKKQSEGDPLHPSIDVKNSEDTVARWNEAIHYYRSILPERMIDADPVVVNLLVDVSGSMDGTKLRAVKLGLIALILQLRGTNDMVNITTFSTSFSSITSGFRRVSDVLALLPDLLADMDADGGTALFDTIITGMQELRKVEYNNCFLYPQMKSIVIALSDGEDNESHLKSHAIAHRLADPGMNNFMFIAVAVGLSQSVRKNFLPYMKYRHCKLYTVNVKSGARLVQVFQDVFVNRISSSSVEQKRFYQLNPKDRQTVLFHLEKDRNLDKVPADALVDVAEEILRDSDDEDCSECESVCHTADEYDSDFYPVSRQMKQVTVDPTYPDWKNINAEEVSNYEMILPTSIDSVLEDLEADEAFECISNFPNRDHIHLKVAPSPFYAGSRAIYYAMLVTKTRNGTSTESPLIIKESRHTSPLSLTKEKNEEYISCHCMAKFFAMEFNRVKPKACSTIEFVDASIVQFAARKGQPYCIMENPIVDDFEKYNNNNGYCSQNPTHDAIQAFSHWTYCSSKEQMMVVDCQGAYNARSNTFHLTDPALHYIDVSRFGGKNLGQVGMNRFFDTHVCNSICRNMGLKPVPMKP
mmetsp:Transcript_24553/g.26855  ORF Transcript_24553/g.26855 Transcript_24553/m.26855 type:complete len:591 (-) Transcript_24553:152-1924(-)|eukprot:gene2055-2191_t